MGGGQDGTTLEEEGLGTAKKSHKAVEGKSGAVGGCHLRR